MKNERVVLRVSEDEKTRLENQAKSSGMKMSRYIRELISEEKVMPKLDEAQSNNLKKLYFEIGKIGTNINQIAYNFNTRLSPSAVAKDEDYSLLKSDERSDLNILLEDLRNQLFEVRKEVADFTRKAS